LLFGVFMLVMGGLLGFTSQVLSGRAATPVADEIADQLLDELESAGASFQEEEEAHQVLFGTIWNELAYKNNAGAFYMLALFGLGPIMFGLYPSRKPKQIQ
tara:strand:- start:72572 stop:72874 length:303 start_codon:yes stop_codon:yes gene_type:complete